MRVGLLAYGAIGREHNLAIQSVPGWKLTAVCDVNPERVAAAQELAPDAAGFSDATQMLDSGLVDIVVISTPPNTHFEWARATLERGIHVVLEKPMALTAVQCDEVLRIARDKDLTLVVYQNRRFDPDYVTMRRLIREGAIGEVFTYEGFVGGYSRPCDYWHSDADVSGGAIFDWGSHYIDQILDLFGTDVAHVAGINHKRQWLHATNADHAEVTITFTDGRQARFINSDLAAARRPKFYALGTEGAIVGDWDPQAEPAVADLPALISLHIPGSAPRVIDLDAVSPFTFHRELAAFLATGLSMQVLPVHSRNVVALMEAAEQSAANGSTPVVPELVR
ncbi:MAG: Gfo/Idh/MocA family oxidoreductase [Actinobacteria bacterium]|nr:Gfo/Idh/MocA family oxidoreductase [Actinomycetota bacterium]